MEEIKIEIYVHTYKHNKKSIYKQMKRCTSEKLLKRMNKLCVKSPFVIKCNSKV